MGVRAAAEALVARAAELGLHGRTLTPDERQRVATGLPAYPVWLLDLLSTVPLCGLRLGWQAYAPEPDFDGVVWMEVSDGAAILLGSLILWPGVGVLPSGYFYFGDGEPDDPYSFFVCAHEGGDPPLYELYHDLGSDADAILTEGRRLVSPQLSEFFRVAVLTGAAEDAEPGAAADPGGM